MKGTSIAASGAIALWDLCDCAPAILQVSPRVNVNAVAPGAIRTRAHDRLPREVIDKVRQSVPMGFVAEPEDVAGVVAFLASEDARYITGQTLLIDGGRWML